LIKNRHQARQLQSNKYTIGLYALTDSPKGASHKCYEAGINKYTVSQ